MKMIQFNKRQQRMVLFAGLYASQYTSIGFISITLVTLLREQGASLAQLGLVNLILVPMSFKFLWAPLVDRYGRRRHTHYRNWLIPTQGLMCLTLIVATYLPPSSHLSILLILLFAFACLVATQDIALDALACTLLSAQERPQLNAVQVGSGMLGNIIGGGLMPLAYRWLEWQGSFYLLVILMLPFWVALFRLREEPVAYQRKNMSIWREQWHFLRDEWRWFGIIVLYAMGVSSFALLNPMLVDGGWELADIGVALRIFGSIVGLLSAIAAAPILRRYGRRKNILFFSLMQALCSLALLPVVLGNTEPLWVYASIAAYFLSFTPLHATLSTLMMDKAVQRFAVATAYTIQSAFAMLFALLATTLVLTLAQYIGKIPVVIVSAMCTLIGGISIYYYSGKHHDATCRLSCQN